MFSRQKRYLSEAGIIRSIDHENQLKHAACVRGEYLTEKAKECLKMAHDEKLPVKDRNTFHFEYRQYSEEAAKLFRKAELKEARVKTLGEKLAAFRTRLLSFETDPAVV